MGNKQKSAVLVVAMLSLLAASAASAQVTLPPEVETQIDSLVSQVVVIGGYVMAAVITATGTFALIKWVRRGINRV